MHETPYQTARRIRQEKEDWYAELQHKQPAAKHSLRLAWQELRLAEQAEDAAKSVVQDIFDQDVADAIGDGIAE